MTKYVKICHQLRVVVIGNKITLQHLQKYYCKCCISKTLN